MKRPVWLILAFAALTALLMSCASGEDTVPGDSWTDDNDFAETDLTIDTDDEADGEEDPIEDVEDAETGKDLEEDRDNDVSQDPDADTPEEIPDDGEDAEDIIEEDPAEEDVLDPCEPNPCTNPPDDRCLDAATARLYESPGECTPLGGLFTCDYPQTDEDCSESGDMICREAACSNTIAQVRAAGDGEVDFTVRGVYVTYVKPSSASRKGFYIQRARSGPGLFMYSGSSTPSVDPGNMINVRITSVTRFHGLKEADDFAVISNDGEDRDVEFLIQDFGSGGTINEDTESELIRIYNATITSGWIERYGVSYGSSGSTHIQYEEFPSLTPRVCPGMVIDILAPAGEYDGTYMLTPFESADFLSLDATPCAAIDNSNWDFEDWTWTDPPEDFEKATEFFTATQEASTVNNGSYSAELAWTSQDNQDFYQAWHTPVARDTPYTFHVWYNDTDARGRARTAVQPYDAILTPLTKEYGSYTSDSPSWRELTLTTTPEADGFVRPLLRLYDISEHWEGSAALFIDDWALTVPITYDVENGRTDTWTTTDPGSVPLVAGTFGLSMEIYGGVNDAGLLYVATNEVTFALSDHILYVWIGDASATATVPAAWSKSGTVAAPDADAHLLAFAQEESNGYCEVVRWNTSGADWEVMTASCGYDGAPNGVGYVEASVDLVSLPGVTRVRDLPGMTGFAVAPYGTGNGGTPITDSQIPDCVFCDENIDDEEIAVTHRAIILLGNVKP